VKKKKKRIKKARSQKLQQKSQLPLLATSLPEKKKDKKERKKRSKEAPTEKKTEESTTEAPVVNTEERGGALDVFLHPLVIINISDHFTREKMSAKSKNPRVYGALLGIQTGRRVEVYNSFELIVTEVEGASVVDPTYLNRKKEQLSKVFPTYEFLGWYSTGKEVKQSDIAIQKQIMAFNESPLYLLLSPLVPPQARELPLTLYESEVKMVDDSPTLVFTRVNYKIETGDAERIAVDHVANVGGASANVSMLTSHLSNLHNAIKMLHMRISIILEYLRQTTKGKLPTHYGTIRQIATLCNLLPTIDTDQFKQDFINEYNDALLVTYLAGVTKTSNTINELIDKFNITYDRHSRRRGFW